MNRMKMKTEILPAEGEAIAKAADLLRRGELVALPTETVYGIAADARNGAAVAKIFVAKITKNNLIAGQKGFLFTPAHYLNPIGMAVFRQTASDKNDFTSSVVYQNPGWKIEGDTGAQPVE